MVDKERIEFLQWLDKSDTQVSEWEASFIESMLKWGDDVNLTPKRCDVIDKMMEKYGDGLRGGRRVK